MVGVVTAEAKGALVVVVADLAEVQQAVAAELVVVGVGRLGRTCHVATALVLKCIRVAGCTQLKGAGQAIGWTSHAGVAGFICIVGGGA